MQFQLLPLITPSLATDGDEYERYRILLGSQTESMDTLFVGLTDQTPEEGRMNFMEAYCPAMRNNMSGIRVSVGAGNYRNTPIHYEAMYIPTEERIGTRVLPTLREKLGHTRCPDPEKGVEQQYLHPHHQKDNHLFEEHGQRISHSGLRVLLELILWCFSTASCWMMERLAQPGVNPSATIFLVAIWSYATATGSLYFMYSTNPFIDVGIICSGVFGMVCGWIVQWTLEEILFRLLPGFILSSLVLSGMAASIVKGPALE